MESIHLFISMYHIDLPRTNDLLVSSVREDNSSNESIFQIGLCDEVWDWCCESLSCPVELALNLSGVMSIHFENAQDMVLFKLRWL